VGATSCSRPQSQHFEQFVSVIVHQKYLGVKSRDRFFRILSTNTKPFKQSATFADTTETTSSKKILLGMTIFCVAIASCMLQPNRMPQSEPHATFRTACHIPSGEKDGAITDVRKLIMAAKSNKLFNSHVGHALSSKLFNSHVGHALNSKLFNSHVGHALSNKLFNSHVGHALSSKLFNSHVGHALNSKLFNSHVAMR
jgi:hypothetical protein